MNPFMPQMTINMIFITNRNFSIPEIQCVPSSWTQARCDKPTFSLFVNISFAKTCFYVDITHSSVNSAWFALLS